MIGPSKILTGLLQDHVVARRVLAGLEQEVDRVAQFHAPAPEVIDEAMRFFGGHMAGLHHSIEDMIFSALTRAAPGEAAEAQKVAREHEEAAPLFARLADAAAELAADPDHARPAFCRVARGLIAFSRHHLRREENRFFVSAREHLTPEDWRRIAQMAEGLESTLAGGAPAPRRFDEQDRDVGQAPRPLRWAPA